MASVLPPGAGPAHPDALLLLAELDGADGNDAGGGRSRARLVVCGDAGPPPRVASLDDSSRSSLASSTVGLDHSADRSARAVDTERSERAGRLRPSPEIPNRGLDLGAPARNNQLARFSAWPRRFPSVAKPGEKGGLRGSSFPGPSSLHRAATTRHPTPIPSEQGDAREGDGSIQEISLGEELAGGRANRQKTALPNRHQQVSPASSPEGRRPARHAAPEAGGALRLLRCQRKLPLPEHRLPVHPTLWQKWLNRRSQGNHLPWVRFKRLLERFELPRPRIYHLAGSA